MANFKSILTGPKIVIINIADVVKNPKIINRLH